MTSFSFPTTTVRATTQRFLEPAPVGIGMRGRAVASAFDCIVGFAREEEFGEFGEGEVGREEEKIEHGVYFFFLPPPFRSKFEGERQNGCGVCNVGVPGQDGVVLILPRSARGWRDGVGINYLCVRVRVWKEGR